MCMHRVQCVWNVHVCAMHEQHTLHANCMGITLFNKILIAHKSLTVQCSCTHSFTRNAEQCMHSFTRIAEQCECNARVPSNAHALQKLWAMVAHIARIHCTKKVLHTLLHSPFFCVLKQTLTLTKLAWHNFWNLVRPSKISARGPGEPGNKVPLCHF